MKPLFVDQAAKVAGVSADKVSAAMSNGELAWKRFKGHRATTWAWVREWTNA
jgi:hypothetical protein